MDRTWTPASFYDEGDDGQLECTLCPHACRLEDGGMGLCGVRRRRGDQMETTTRGLTLQHFDPIEKKPLYHYRPGTQTLTLASPGCSFRCHYCLNYRLSQHELVPAAAWRNTPADTTDLVATARAHGAAVALSYSEPSLAAELTLDLAREAHSHQVDLLWKTNGFLTEQAGDVLMPHLAAVNIDLKTVENSQHRTLTGAPVAPVLSTLERLVEKGIWVEVSTPVIPKLNDGDSALRKIARAISKVSADIPWHLLRFIPEFRMRKSDPTSPQGLERAVQIGKEEGLRYAYVERALGEEGRTTFCPQCETAVVRRGIWSLEANLLEEGICPGCGSSIPGRW